MVLPPADFESAASTNSAIPAGMGDYRAILQRRTIRDRAYTSLRSHSPRTSRRHHESPVTPHIMRNAPGRFRLPVARGADRAAAHRRAGRKPVAALGRYFGHVCRPPVSRYRWPSRAPRRRRAQRHSGNQGTPARPQADRRARRSDDRARARSRRGPCAVGCESPTAGGKYADSRRRDRSDRSRTARRVLPPAVSRMQGCFRLARALRKRAPADVRFAPGGRTRRRALSDGLCTRARSSGGADRGPAFRPGDADGTPAARCHTGVSHAARGRRYLSARARPGSRYTSNAQRAVSGAPDYRGCDRTRAAGGRVLAVGTTTLRALESAAGGGSLAAGYGETNLFILPGYRFRVVERLLTNFHLPRSTLVMLVSAFAGTDNIGRAYRHAIDQRYRFFSYGDAMLIEKKSDRDG